MKKAMIQANSNGLKEYDLNPLKQTLKQFNIETIESPYIYANKGVKSAPAIKRAKIFNEAFQDDTIDYILDISGGDIANEILDYIDYDALKPKLFVGYSDLTTIINALYTIKHYPSLLFQVRHLVDNEELLNIAINKQLLDIKVHSLNNQPMQGIVVGGNIRCLLKLAGTKYFPDMKDKILLLEAYSGDEAKLITYINQLKQMNVFNEISGLLLGTYSQYYKDHTVDDLYNIYKQYIPNNLPVFYTMDIGHGKDAKAIMIGKYYQFMLE